MFEISKISSELKSLVDGLKSNGFVDLVESESFAKDFIEMKFSIETRSLDLLKKWLEVNVFIYAMASGTRIAIYSCGPITNKSGWSVIHLRLEALKTQT